MQRTMHTPNIRLGRKQLRPFISIAHGAHGRRTATAAARLPPIRAGHRSSATSSTQPTFANVTALIAPARSRCTGSSHVCQAKPKSAGEFEVTQQQLPGCAVKLSVKVPAQVVKKCENRVVDKLSKLMGKMPGFPANKPLPLGMVIDRCGGPKKFAVAVIEEVLLLSYQQVMEPFDKVMFPDSDTMLTNVNDLVDALDSSKPLEYELQFEMLPTVRWKSPYKDIQITIQDTGSEETDAAAADDFIQQELKRKGYQRIVTGRGLEAGDVAVIDMVVKLPGSQQPIPGMSKELLAFDTEVDPLGLTPHMGGLQPGEGRQFEIRFPQDFGEEELRGRPAEVTVKVHELFTWALPEFDQEFVKKHYPQYETPAAMRQAIINTTAMQRFQQRDQDIQEAFLVELVKIVDAKVPEHMVEMIGANEYQRTLLMEVGAGKLKLKEAEELMTEEKVQGYLEANRAYLEDLAKVQLGSQEIIDAEGIKADEAVLAAEVESAKRDFESRHMDYDEERLKDQAAEAIKGVSLLNWVKDNCKIEIRPFTDAGAS